MVIASPRRDGHRAVPGAPGGGRHVHDVGVEVARPGSWTAIAAIPWTWARVGTRPPSGRRLLLLAAAAAWAARHRVGVVGQHDHLLRPRLRWIAVEDLTGARPPTGPALDHHGAGLCGTAPPAPDPAPPRPPRPVRRALGAAGRAPGPSARRSGSPGSAAGRPASMPASTAPPTSSTCTWTFHRPSPPTTTSESPSGCRRGPQGRDPLVVGVEEVHHLVGRAVLGEVAGRAGGCGIRCRCPSGRARRRRVLTGHRGLGRVEDHAQAPAAGVDHTRVARAAGAVGRAGEGLPGGVARPRAARRRAAPRGPAARSTAAWAAALGHVRIVPSTGLPTAAYAAPVAAISPSANTAADRSSGPAWRPSGAAARRRAGSGSPRSCPRAPSRAPRA